MKIHKQSGLSLVEIMVAMVISIFLLGGVVQVYTANRATYGFSEAISRVQENGRFSMEMISADLRMAGFWGSTTFTPGTIQIRNNINSIHTDYDFINQPPVRGTIDTVDNDGTNGSDTFTIRGTIPGMATVTTNYLKGQTNNLFINTSDFFQVGDIALLSSFDGADLFEVTSVNGTEIGHSNAGALGNLTGTFSKSYNAQLSSVHKLQTVTYTIELNDNNEPALFRQIFSQPKQELIEGIEQMQILYGINTDTGDTTPNQYIISDNVTDWTQVTAVRVMLLLISPENVGLEQTQKYDFNGVKGITAADNRLRQVYTTTIALRNRV